MFGIKFIAELTQLRIQSMPSGVLTKYKIGVHPSHGLWRHDLVGQRVFQHAILVYTSFMGKGIYSHDSFVGLHRNVGQAADKLAGCQKLLGVDARIGFVKDVWSR